MRGFPALLLGIVLAIVFAGSASAAQLVSLNAVMATGNQSDLNAFDNTNGASGNASGTGITISTCTTCALFVTVNMGVGSNQPDTPRSCTHNGDSMTEVTSSFNDNGVEDNLWFVLVNPDTGNNAISCAWSNVSSADAYISAIAFNCVDQTTPYDNVTIADAATANITGDATGATISSFLTNGSEPTTTGTKFWGYSSLDPGGAGLYIMNTNGTNTHTYTGAGGSTPVLSGLHVRYAGGACDAGGGASVKVNPMGGLNQGGAAANPFSTR
jgi:hypothetical protein